MLEERVPESPSAVPRDAKVGVTEELSGIDTPFARLLAEANMRMERFRVIADHLSLALRIADAPEGIDRTTIPLALPLGPEKLKELGALVRLSPYLRADIQAMIAMYRSEREELRRLARAARVQATDTTLAITQDALYGAKRLFTWLPLARLRFRDHAQIQAVLDLNPGITELISVVARATRPDHPAELADLLQARPSDPTPSPASAPPAPAAPSPLARLTSWFQTLGGKPGTESQAESGEADLHNPENVMRCIGVPPLTLELGQDLVQLVDPSSGGDLMDRIVPMRLSIGLDLGFIMPGVQIRDNLTLPPNGYRILVRNNVVARGELLPGLVAALQTAQVEDDEPLPGFEATEPVYGHKVYWIPPHLSKLATSRGYQVHEPANVLITHLDRAVRMNAYDILAYEEVVIMTNKVAEKSPTLVKAIMGEVMSPAELHQVLRCLLREGVSIRDLGTILERLSHLLVFPRIDPNMGNPGTYVTVHLDPSDQFFERQFERLERALPRAQAPLDTQALVEALRQSLAREICGAIADPSDNIDVVTLHPDLELQLIEAVVAGRDGKTLSLAPRLADRVLAAISETCRHMDLPVIACDVRLRAALKRFTARAIPALRVLSHAELHPQFRVRTVDTIAWSHTPGPRDPER